MDRVIFFGPIFFITDLHHYWFFGDFHVQLLILFKATLPYFQSDASPYCQDLVMLTHNLLVTAGGGTGAGSELVVWDVRLPDVPVRYACKINNNHEPWFCNSAIYWTKKAQKSHRNILTEFCPGLTECGPLLLHAKLTVSWWCQLQPATFKGQILLTLAKSCKVYTVWLANRYESFITTWYW